MQKKILPNTPPLYERLRKLLKFSSQEGQIWLGGQRMLLLQADMLKAIRRELIEQMGVPNARRFLSRIGYAAGRDDGILARQMDAQGDVLDKYWVGPQLHMLSGFVHVQQPKVFEYSAQEDHFRGVFEWHRSWEAEVHAEMGVQTGHEPACWLLIGYASGYSSAFFQRPVIYKERSCKACGHAFCEVEGRFAHEWEDEESYPLDAQERSSGIGLQPIRTPDGGIEQALPDEVALIGQAPAFLQSTRLLQQAASTLVTVLFTGETGVGKERFARALHALSRRADGPFLAINCAALPADLVESELFGVEKGAFTGAQSARQGRFERADGGTLMLDEIGEMSLPAQAKLLRVLQSGEVERLGGTETVKVDVRVVAATNVNLEQAVADGKFRRDLLYRLNVYPIEIPALKERRQDIDVLAHELLRRFNALHDKTVVGFTQRATHAMRNHDWPGNVRQLENAVERAVILTPSEEEIDLGELFPEMLAPMSETLNESGLLPGPEASQAPNEPKPAPQQLFELLEQCGQSLEALETETMTYALQRARGNVAAAARSLGMTRAQLSYRLAKQAESGA